MAGRHLWPGPAQRRAVQAAVVLLASVAALAVSGGGVPAAAGQAPTGEGSRLRIGFGPATIWQPSREAISALQACPGLSFGCIRGVMEAQGAGEDAIAFYHLTGWFLTELQDTGVVKLGTILNPWRANENYQSALLGGVPAAIYPEEEASRLGFNVAVTRNPQLEALQAAHPEAILWTAGASLHGIETSPQGGPRFVFGYRVLDGCHACPMLGEARGAFDFGPDGTFFGLRLLDVVPD